MGRENYGGAEGWALGWVLGENTDFFAFFGVLRKEMHLTVL